MQIDRGKQNVLGVGVDAVNYDAAVERVIQAAQGERPLSVAAVSVHGIMTAVRDAEHRYRLNHVDLVVPDGQPVRWALNLLHGAALRDRVYGPTLALKLWQQAAALGIPVFFYGSRGGVLQALQERLAARIPRLRVVGCAEGQFRQLTVAERDAIVASIRSSGARLVFVGLGCPRQEVWVYENRDLIGVPVIAVGAAFDFHAGLLPQAPWYLQRIGLEWLYRLIQEPRRLWRRYLVTNPPYLALVALQAARLGRFDPVGARAPSSELRYG